MVPSGINNDTTLWVSVSLVSVGLVLYGAMILMPLILIIYLLWRHWRSNRVIIYE